MMLYLEGIGDGANEEKKGGAEGSESLKGDSEG